MRKVLNIIISIAIFIFISWSLNFMGNIAHLFYSDDSCKQSTNNRLLSSLPEILQQDKLNNTTIHLKDITPFQWDRFYIMQPYTTDFQLISLFGFEPKLLGCTNIYFKDDRNLLIFQKDDELVAYADVTNNISWGYFTRSEAISKDKMIIHIKNDKNHIKLSKLK